MTSEDFRVCLHHGGAVKRGNRSIYLGGKVKEWVVDKDLISPIGYTTIPSELVYLHECSFLVLIPNTCGLEFLGINNDHDLLNIMGPLKNADKLDVYVEHFEGEPTLLDSYHPLENNIENDRVFLIHYNKSVEKGSCNIHHQNEYLNSD